MLASVESVNIVHTMKKDMDIQKDFLEPLDHETPLYKCSEYAEGIPYRLLDIAQVRQPTIQYMVLLYVLQASAVEELLFQALIFKQSSHI